MKLILSKPRGFCAGVVRAIGIVEEALKIWGAPIYVRHEIVHNRHVVERLEKMGAVFIDELKDVPEQCRVIYSAHGISPLVRLEAKKRGLIEIDATCPLVTKVHSAVKRHANKGYNIVLIGHKTHVEIIGTAGEAPEKTYIVENVSDVDNLSINKDVPLFYTTQTTLSMDDVADISKALLKKYPHIETLSSSSICFATTNRQHALISILKRVDVVFVIGDITSSNSNRLREVAEKRGVVSYLVNSPDSIEEYYVNNAKVIGLTAGASTPESIVNACIDRLRVLGVQTVEEDVFIEEDIIFQLPKIILEAK